VATVSTPGQEPAPKAYLLNVGKGQIFNSIGSDDKYRRSHAGSFGPKYHSGFLYENQPHAQQAMSVVPARRNAACRCQHGLRGH
jgi:hypothetical protein